LTRCGVGNEPTVGIDTRPGTDTSNERFERTAEDRLQRRDAAPRNAGTRPALTASPLTAFLDLRRRLETERVGTGGVDTCAALTDALDTALVELAEDIGSDTAVVALGGYGRREQCLWSDVDIMVLHRDRDTESLVRAILYPLWDANLKVGHAVRTVAENISAGRESFETLTSLLSARLVAGDAALFDELMAAVTDLVRPRPLAPALVARLASD